MNLFANRFAVRRFGCFVLGMTVLAAAPLAQAGDDDFADNNNAPQWLVIQDNAAALGIAEVNGHVEVDADGSSSAIDDAIFLSDATAGFALSTAADFEIQIQFTLEAFASVGSFGDGFAFVFGVGEDLDGQNSAAIGWALGNAGVGTLSTIVSDYRVNDVSTGPSLLGAGPDVTALPGAITLVAAYDTALDRLTLAVPALTLSTNLDGLVQGQWGASALRYSFGARGEGYSVAGDEAYFDNFEVVSGRYVPEPGTLALAGAAVVGLALRSRTAVVRRRK
ncbi:MAG: PEP-CTERM sorting domain-containing protein [Planctomycetales bacterium]|nr:PEP-CTERM sorting domain-containing protein [Planctomycetales bacterium]